MHPDEEDTESGPNSVHYGADYVLSTALCTESTIASMHCEALPRAFVSNLVHNIDSSIRFANEEIDRRPDSMHSAPEKIFSRAGFDAFWRSFGALPERLGASLCG